MKWLVSILILGLIIWFHEFGHFIVAKLNGVGVTEFSLGFGPRLISTVRGGTRYSLKLLPFGGSCQMKGMLYDGTEEEGDTSRFDEDSFETKSVGRRMMIVLAGPFFNFLLAFLFSILLITISGYDPTTVTEVAEGSPAKEAGLLAGDEIRSINGKRMEIRRDITMYFSFRELGEHETLDLVIQRDGEPMEVSFPVHGISRSMLGITYTGDDAAMVLSSVAEDSPAARAGLQEGDEILSVDGTAVESGAAFESYMKAHPLTDEEVILEVKQADGTRIVSVTPEVTTYVTPGFSCYAPLQKTNALGVLRYSFVEIRFWIGTVFRSIGMFFTGQAGVKDLSGPVGVVNVISDTYEESRAQGLLVTLASMIELLILLSANVGVMNLLPIPAIDGGRFLFLLMEAIAGRRVNRKVEGVVNFVGMALLMLLMFYVMWSDIGRLF